jgi:hypothetical protein
VDFYHREILEFHAREDRITLSKQDSRGLNDLIEHPEKEINANVGIDKPNTEGNKPAFINSGIEH